MQCKEQHSSSKMSTKSQRTKYKMTATTLRDWHRKLQCITNKWLLRREYILQRRVPSDEVTDTQLLII